MASLNFDNEKQFFMSYYDENYALLIDAKNSFFSLLYALTRQNKEFSVSKIEGRVKDREECIGKFNRKYRQDFEARPEEYEIRTCITDLIGLRIVCLYEDEVEKIKKLIDLQFEILVVTNKTLKIEETEDAFGYKGLHLDLKLDGQRKGLPENAAFADLQFELQIRTAVQDSWSVLDHKIKYKKSIPLKLKRKINRLAALFDLADSEFQKIRDETAREIAEEEKRPNPELDVDSTAHENGSPEISKSSELNAFMFLRIAKHFFFEFDFEPHKVDGFTQEIIALKPGITRGKFNFYMRENITKVKKYRLEVEEKSPSENLNPYSIIKHCLYLGESSVFFPLLTSIAKEKFDDWLPKTGTPTI